MRLLTFLLVLTMHYCANAQTAQPPIPPIGSRYKHRLDAAKQQDLPLPPVKFGDPPLEEMIGRKTPKPDEDGDDPRDTPPPTFYGEEIDLESDKIVYVLDRSGSMHGPRMESVKTQTANSVNALSNNIRFDIVAYGAVIIGCFQKLVDASEDNKNHAIRFVNNLTAGGGTPTGEAMSLSFKQYDCLNYVLLTDGRPNGGTFSTREFIKNNNIRGAQIDVFGMAATGDLRAFCQGVAADSEGKYTDIP